MVRRIKCGMVTTEWVSFCDLFSLLLLFFFVVRLEFTFGDYAIVFIIDAWLPCRAVYDKSPQCVYDFLKKRYGITSKQIIAAQKEPEKTVPLANIRRTAATTPWFLSYCEFFLFLSFPFSFFFHYFFYGDCCEPCLVCFYFVFIIFFCVRISILFLFGLYFLFVNLVMGCFPSPPPICGSG